MNLNDLKTINVPHDAPIRFIENGTRKSFTSAGIYNMTSFRGNHSMSAFPLEDRPYADQTFGELLEGLEGNIGSDFEWGGDLGRYHYTFSEETELAFPTHYRSCDGTLVAWYFDGITLMLMLENY